MPALGSLASHLWQIEFSSAIEANPVGAVFNGEHAAPVTMTASKNKLKNPKQRVHRS
jgi:hypothetical protein